MAHKKFVLTQAKGNTDKTKVCMFYTEQSKEEILLETHARLHTKCSADQLRLIQYGEYELTGMQNVLCDRIFTGNDYDFTSGYVLKDFKKLMIEPIFQVFLELVHDWGTLPESVLQDMITYGNDTQARYPIDKLRPEVRGVLESYRDKQNKPEKVAV